MRLWRLRNGEPLCFECVYPSSRATQESIVPTNSGALGCGVTHVGAIRRSPSALPGFSIMREAFALGSRDSAGPLLSESRRRCFGKAQTLTAESVYTVAIHSGIRQRGREASLAQVFDKIRRDNRAIPGRKHALPYLVSKRRQAMLKPITGRSL